MQHDVHSVAAQPISTTQQIRFFCPADVWNATNGCSTKELPTACTDAQNSAESTAGLLGTAVAIVLFFAFPIIGRLSDAFGRRPLFIFSISVYLLNSTSAWLYEAYGVSLLWNYVCAFVASFSALNVALLSFLADITLDTPKERSTAFAVTRGLLGTMSIIGYSIMAFLTSAYSNTTILLIAMVCEVVIIVYTLLFVPETLHTDRRTAFEFQWSLLVPTHGLRVLGQGRSMRWLTCAFFFSSVATSMVLTIASNYAQNTFALNTHDQTLIGLVISVSSIVANVRARSLIAARKLIARIFQAS